MKRYYVAGNTKRMMECYDILSLPNSNFNFNADELYTYYYIRHTISKIIFSFPPSRYGGFR